MCAVSEADGRGLDNANTRAAMADSYAEKQGTLIDADAALRYVASEAPPMTAEDEKRLVRKIDWSIVPLMCTSSLQAFCCLLY